MSKKNNSLYKEAKPGGARNDYGYKNKEKALKTIESLKGKSRKYQFAVVNSMYNRAKFHPKINDDMKEAMKVFENWLVVYRTGRKKGGQLVLDYPCVAFVDIKPHIPTAVDMNLLLPNSFNRRFLIAYAKAAGKLDKLDKKIIKKRNQEITKLLNQAKKSKVGNKIPKKIYISLIMKGFLIPSKQL